ncbi:sister chromatid cohesion protein DCC1 [Pistacia vera]|uniref:sister chromatid cohesion protein DCC1 n=1 Tax=Pistacia vera TaxID=55513 RepID=UPI00126356C3|nr:sister chromatid cohesion protein DCC1 [Pistacia vera]XP_031277589.1 sister chromatid cohesion protein DCC1 [Pistacia vera]XP_031277590.1 sister chromatid cohesion protein DCC1 [Pistacia vera]
MEIMEQARPVCRGAGAVLNLQPSSSISIAYHTHFGPHDDLILLEVDEKLLPDFFHQRVSLRGERSEDAVLCTQSKTYSIKFVGTSNSVFLTPPLDNSILYENSEDCNGKDNHKAIVSVIKVAPGNMELVEVAPRLDKLKLLLSEYPYSSREASEFEDLEEMDKSITKRMYSWDDLVDEVQASDNELRSGLLAISAVEIDGYWRIVDEKYMSTILIMLLHNSVLNDWSLDALNEDEVVSMLVSDGFPLKLSHHCLHVFGSKVEEGAGGSCLWRLDERRVCVHFAREILVEGKRKMDNFMEEWKQKVPKGMHPDFEMLEGEVLKEKFGVESWVHAFSVSSLPSTPAERFSTLFRERPKWEQKDLLPYIRDLNVPGLSLEGLLLKYTRRTQPTLDAEPVFSAR